MFKIIKVRVKVKGYLNSHDFQNQIKQKDNDLEILGIMVIDLIHILAH